MSKPENTSVAPDASSQVPIIGHGLQIIEVTKENRYILNEKDIESVLLREEIKDLPVVLVSAAGPTRAGKSFLLNIFLRYLKSSKESQESGSWLADNSDRLEGFRWHVGSKTGTTGILLWSEPLITTTSSGEKVAVLLMDTGNISIHGSILDISDHLSSVQIFNVPENIKEYDLQKLRFAGSGNKSQVLEFIVRDWSHPSEFEYGAVGGDKMLEDIFKETPAMTTEAKDLRKDLRKSYEKISAYLMPHPGFKVFSPDFKGDIADLAPEFRDHLRLLTSSIFGPEKLQPKIVDGKKVKATELLASLKTYLAIINHTGPAPNTVVQSTAAVNTTRDSNTTSKKA